MKVRVFLFAQKYGDVAQRLAQVSYKHKVVGSNPTFTTKCICSSVVERLSVKQRVIGSIPIEPTKCFFKKLLILFITSFVVTLTLIYSFGKLDRFTKGFKELIVLNEYAVEARYDYIGEIFDDFTTIAIKDQELIENIEKMVGII